MSAPTAAARPRLLAVSGDKAFVGTLKGALDGAEDFALDVVEAPIEAAEVDVRRERPDGLILDVDAAGPDQFAALRQILRHGGEGMPTLVVTGSFDPEAARAFLKMRLSDFLVKPVASADLLRTVRRVMETTDEEEVADSRIYTFVPASGGAGNTTLVIQTAFLLHEQDAGKRQSTCVVDLNLQNGSCAEYLDLEPRFDISEIENAPDRLDRQLLEVMLSRHKSGLAVVSAPPCPWEMRSFRPDLVTRLLDLVSTYFDNVVIDMPRTWFPWTDSILAGSDRVFVVTEMTVPALRHTQRMARAIQDRVGRDARLSVVVNRADPRGGGSFGVKEKDVVDVLGGLYAGRISNNYRVVREALDRGVPLRDVSPNCDVLADLRRVVMPEEQRADRPGGLRRLSPLGWFGGRLAAAR
jgi:pilus assembly protein CpaE